MSILGRKLASSFFLFLTVAVVNAADPAPQQTSYTEIPYYLRQLEMTDLESKRIEFNKIIHDAVANADLSDKKTVKKMEPIIARIRAAIDAKLDRPYIEGQSMWLQSAVDFFEREKNQQVISLPQSDWLPLEAPAKNGARISIFPDKILLLENDKSKVIAQSSNIHEAILSPDGRRVAFFRQTDDTSHAEIWVVDTRKLTRKKIAVYPSCNTLLFSLEGNRLFVQEKPSANNPEPAIHRISLSGGGERVIGKASSLETVVMKGRYEGKIIVYASKTHHLGISKQQCPYAWDASGEKIGRIKDVACR